MLARGREISAADWIRLGEACRDQGMLFLLLTGGEPFLRKDFREIYTALHKMGLLISINSNGTLIDENIVGLLEEFRPARINVTMYGGSNETYARLCANPKGFDQVTRGIRRLREVGIPVVINASFTRLNVQDMEAIYAFAKEMKLPVRPAVYMFPPVRSAKDGKVDEEARFSPEEAGFALYHTKECDLSPAELGKLRQRVCQGLPDLEDNEECTRTPDEHMGCMAGRSAFWVTWDGRMTPCGMMNEPVVHPFVDGFAESWQELIVRVNDILLPAECTACKRRPACMLCGALALAEGQGDATKRPDYLCRMTDAYIRRCRDGAVEE